METKICTCCGEEKPLNDVNKQNYQSEIMKKRWEDSDYREKMTKQSQELWENEEYKEKFYLSVRSDSHRKLLSDKLKGIKKSDETKERMSNNNKNKVKIKINGVEYNCITDASKILNIDRKTISQRLNSKNFTEYEYIDKIPDYEKSKMRARKYRKDNKEKLSIKRKINRDENPIKKLKENIHSLIYNKIRKKGYSKKSKTYEILGCSYDEFKLHIESQFQEWMNWDNYGLYNGELNYGWDIDHIIPISSATTEEDVLQLNHYTNLQPLCSKVNRNIKRHNKDWGK